MISLQSQLRDDVVMMPVVAVALAPDVYGDGQQARQCCNAGHDSAHMDRAVQKVPVDNIVGQSISQVSEMENMIGH